MKKNYSWIMCLLCLATTLRAEETGYVAFMNAVGLPSKTDLKADGHSVKPAGFPEGNYAESFGLPVGSHTFVFSNADCSPITQTVNIQAGVAPLYILYKTSVQQRDGKITNILKLVIIPAQPHASSQRFLAFYASDRPATVLNVNDSTISLPALKLSSLDGGSLTVTTAGAPKPKRYQPPRGGNYVLIMFDGSDGRIRQALLQME